MCVLVRICISVLITYAIFLADQINHIGRIIRQYGTGRALNVARKLLIDRILILRDGKNNVDRVLFDFLIDLGYARVILNIRVRVQAFIVQMALAVIGSNHPTQFTIASIMKTRVR